MWDVLLIATIVAFFLLAALLVRGLGRVIAGSPDAADDAEADLGAPEHALEPGRRA
jgi:hypothetical protein